MRRLLPALLLAAVAMGACSSRPDGILSKNEMASLMADLELAGAIASQSAAGYSVDSMRRGLREAVLRRHGLDEEAYRANLDWYGHNIDSYYDVCERAEEHLRKEQEKALQLDAPADGNESEIWPYSQRALLSPLSASDGLRFEIEGSVLELGDRLRLTANIDRTVPLMLTLAAEYEDGTIMQGSQLLSGRKRGEVNFQTDSLLKVKRLFGKIALQESDNLPLWLDSISLKKMPMDVDEYYVVRSLRRWKAPQPRRQHLPDTAISTAMQPQPEKDRKSLPSAPGLPPKASRPVPVR